jgi:antitoxin ParD1/3/4
MGKHEKKMVIELSAKQADVVRMLMDTGAFESPEQLVAEALAELKIARLNAGYTDAELKALIDEGLNSGEPLDADVVFAEILEDIENMKKMNSSHGNKVRAGGKN